MSKIHRKLRVEGRVQGVWFRKNTQREARRLGVLGYVQNRMDGSVYIEAEAEEKVMKAFIAWCHQGPERAEVEIVKVSEGQLEGFTEFSIR